MTKFMKYWLIALAGVLTASAYPIYMGASVIRDMLVNGTVFQENYPKYIIPYAPIALSVVLAVVLMPLVFKAAKRFALLTASVFSTGIFFLSELLLESLVTVSRTFTETVEVVNLEGWQMYMCYMPPTEYETRTWTEVNVLMGEYSPAFKLHFYMISVILILSVLNCLYGFGRVLRTGDRSRVKALAVQSVCSLIFLGLCIFACFTAFFRDGEITVSTVSALLMILFFVVLGVTAGVYAGSFTIGKGKGLSLVLPVVISVFVIVFMYIGEMVLLSGHLYRFGCGPLFDGLPGIVLAPVDIFVILMSGVVSGLICRLLNNIKIKS